MQPLPRRSRFTPELPGGEKVEPRAETEFANRESWFAQPALWQTAGFKEDGARLLQPVMTREVNISRTAIDGRPVILPVDIRLSRQACHRLRPSMPDKVCESAEHAHRLIRWFAE